MNTQAMLPIRISAAITLFLLIAGCTTMPPEEQGPGRAELDEMGKKAITALLDSKPELQESLDKSPGYAVVNMNITKIPVVGSGAGYGIVIDQRTNTRSYIKVSQFDVGGGLGAEKFNDCCLKEIMQ